MPLVLVATPGGASSNSYSDVATAQSYFDGRAFSDAWTAATLVQQTQALVHATALLDRERWAGAKGTTYTGALTQALAFPRRWLPTLEVDAAPQLVSEYYIDIALGFFDPALIPVPIVRATCELALELLRAGTTDPLSKDSTRNVKRKRVDVLDTEYLPPWQRVRGLGYFPAVIALIAPLLRASSGGNVERV